MSRKRKMTPAQKASARWEQPPQADAPSQSEDIPLDEKPVNGDHFIISIVLIGIVAIAAVVFSVMQGGYV